MAIMDVIARLQPSIDPTPVPDLTGRVEKFRQASVGSLPEDYEAFLLANGHMMIFPDNRFGGKDVRLNSLYGVDDDPTTLFTANDMYAARLPPGLIAIGDSGGGDLICLDAAGLRPGAVFHWNHEREVDEAGIRQPDYSNLVLLADSFTQALEQVVLKDDSAAPAPKIRKASLRF